MVQHCIPFLDNTSKMKKTILITIFSIIILTLLSETAFAAIGVGALEDLFEEIRVSSETWFPRIAGYVIGLLWFTSLIAFALGCKDLALSGSGLQLEGIVALFVRFAFLVGFMSWILMDPYFLLMIPKWFADLGSYISGREANIEEVPSAFGGLIKPITDYYGKLQYYETGEVILCWFLVLCIHCLGILFIVTILIVHIETIFILIGGMITAAFFVIGYFRDLFMSYLKALAINGLKLLLLSLCLGIMVDIISGWRGVLSARADDQNLIFNTAIPMVAGLLGFYFILRAVISFAKMILTGHTASDSGLIKSAVMAGAAAGATVWNVSRGASQTALDTASSVHNAAQAYRNTSQTVKESGGGTVRATSMAAWEAIKTAMTAPAKNDGYKRSPLMKPNGETANNNRAFDAFKANISYNQEIKREVKKVDGKE